MSQPARDGEMRFRIPPGAIVAQVPQGGASLSPGRPPFTITITGADGAELLRMFERDGKLAVEGDESRWEEGARRFLHGLMQWSGQVGIAWKDEVKKAAQEGGW